jgi:hypothetical protein
LNERDEDAHESRPAPARPRCARGDAVLGSEPDDGNNAGIERAA